MVNKDQAVSRTNSYPRKDSIPRKRIVIATLMLMLTSLIWGGTNVVVKNAFADIEPCWLLVYRYLIAGIIMLVIVFSKLKLITKRMVIDTAVVCIPLAIGFVFLFYGLTDTGASNAAFLSNTSVLFAPLLTWIASRRISSVQVVTAITTMFGLLIFVFDETFHIVIGDMLILVCALSNTFYFMLLDKAAAKYDTMLLTFMQIVWCFIYFVAVAVFISPPPSPLDFSGNVWFALLYTTVLSTVVCYYLNTAAQKVLPPAQVSIICTTQAIFGSILAFIFLHEVLLLRQYLGGLIILGSIIASVLIPQPQSVMASAVANEAIGDEEEDNLKQTR